MASVGVGLWGRNGHQLDAEALRGLPAHLVGGYDCPAENPFDSAEALLRAPEVDLVSVCAPVRAGQGALIRVALRAGKHVLAEKPCVMDERELDALHALARERGLLFYEMGCPLYDAPYNAVRAAIADGRIGEVVQVLAQKSYPYASWRPQDEAIDGGLLLQNAVYGLRFVLQIAGRQVAAMQAMETRAGNPLGGGLRMAAALQLRLDNGGLASIAANYLNRASTGVWGNEVLRVFGTLGFVETDPRTRQAHLYTDEGMELLPELAEPSLTERLIRRLAGEFVELPPAEALTQATRLAIRAKRAIEREETV